MRLIVSWIGQLIVAGILAQTLYFKFLYAPETQYIFARLGGRFAATATGIVELICVVLLLVPRTAVYGAMLSLATIGGAILTHLFIVGITIPNPQTGESDGGLLFILALTVAAGSVVVLLCRREEIPFLGSRRIVTSA